MESIFQKEILKEYSKSDYISGKGSLERFFDDYP